jgi:hypothetical protein
MDTAMSHRMSDRRLTHRHRAVEEHGIISTRVKPGQGARLVDVSAGGALIETGHRLLPGTSVELHMETDSRRTSIRGRVLRCAVVRVRPASVWYRGAIGFDRHLAWFVDASGYQVPAAESPGTQPVWGDATQQVI